MKFADILRRLGFGSYKEYLASDLWASIRKRVLTAGKGKCRACGCTAQCVHHKKYGMAEMSGKDISYLVPLCHKCHSEIEFDSGLKADLPMANRRLNRIILGIGNEHPVDIVPGQMVNYRGKQYTVRLVTGKMALLSESPGSPAIRVRKSKLRV